MVVSMKGKFGVCLLQQSLNDVKMETAYSKYAVGDEVDVRLVPNTNEVKSDLLLMSLKTSNKQQSFGQTDLKEGSSVNGVLKSIKGNCMFIQIGSNGKIPQIGRLHRIEAKPEDFGIMKPGDRVQVKVLKVT